MNSIPKYVVSNTLKRADWNNSTILSGDVAARRREAEGAARRRPRRVREPGPRRRAPAPRPGRRVPAPRLPGHPGQRQADVPRPHRHPPPATDRLTHVQLGGRAADLRAGPGGADEPLRRANTGGPASSRAPSRRPRTSSGRWRRSCSPTSSTRPVGPPRWVTEPGRSCWRPTNGSSRARSTAGTARTSSSPATASWRSSTPRRGPCGAPSNWSTRHARLGVEIRAGIHTGEIERRETGVGGIGVHIAARVLGAAGAGRGRGDEDGARPGDGDRPRVRAARRHHAAWRPR